MISQIRIYTINKGEMDNFLKHFKEDIVALHEKIGVPIVGTWVNRPTKRIHLGQDVQRQSGDRSENQRVPSRSRRRRSQTRRQRREDGSARGRIGVCVEAGSTALTGGGMVPSRRKAAFSLICRLGGFKPSI